MTRPKSRRVKPAVAREGVTIKISVDDEQYAATIRRQKQYMRDAADRLERGDAPDRADRALAVWALRNVAEHLLSEKQRRPVGHQPQVDPGSLAMEFAIMVVAGGVSANKAREKLAEDYDISITAVKNALAKYADAALREVGGPTFKLKTNERE